MRNLSIKVKIILGLVLIILGVIPESKKLILANLIFGFVLLLLFRVPFKYAGKRFLFLLPFFLFSAIFLIIFEGQAGLAKALTYSGRLFFVTMILAIVFYKASIEVFLKTLGELKVPTIFIELAFFTLRFADVFRGELKNMMLSLRSKGFTTGRFFSLKVFKILGGLLGSMLVRSMQRAERIHLGMQSRGYGGTMVRPEKSYVPMRDWAIAGVIFTVMLVIQLAYKEGGFML